MTTAETACSEHVAQEGIIMRPSRHVSWWLRQGACVLPIWIRLREHRTKHSIWIARRRPEGIAHSWRGRRSTAVAAKATRGRGWFRIALHPHVYSCVNLHGLIHCRPSWSVVIILVSGQRLSLYLPGCATRCGCDGRRHTCKGCPLYMRLSYR